MGMIYVVFGMTGEYSDWSEWPVKAFVSKMKAQEFMEAVSAIANELFARVGRYGGSELRGKNPLDPEMRCDYTGVRYHYYEMELV